MKASFSGNHSFLSNFYPCTVTLYEMKYRSVEHAYQAAKSTDPFVRKVIRTLRTQPNVSGEKWRYAKTGKR